MSILSAIIVLIIISNIALAEEDLINNERLYLLPAIEVTARKRKEYLKDIPLQVKKFDEWEIDNANITDTNNLDFHDTSLTNIDPTGGVETRLLIRGVGGSFGIGDYSVGMFIDGVYQGADLYYGRNLIDIESIEILKGPQNTLYGKSTIGGAINVKTKDPEPEQYISYSQHLGVRDFHRESLIFNIPVIDDEFLTRLVFDYEDFDGFHSNPFTGNSRDDDRKKNVRAKTLWLPNEKLEVSTSLSFRERDTDVYTVKLVDDDDGYNQGDYSSDSPNDVTINSRQYSANVTYQLPSDYQLSYLLSHANVIEKDVIDLDRTANPPSSTDPFTNVIAGRRVHGEDYSQEIRLASPDLNWGNWQLGTYYYYLIDKYTQSVNLNTLTAVTLPPSVNIRSQTKSYTYSIFGETNINLSNKNILGLGLRYDHDIRTFHDQGGSEFRDHETFDALSPKVSLTRLVNDQLTIFGLGSIGYKAGGFNPPGIEPFSEEKSTTIEFGFKASPTQHLSLNGSVFYNWLEDQQIIELDIPTVTEFVANSGNSIIRGFEIESIWSPNENWKLRGSFTALDTEFTDFTITANGPNNTPGEFDLDGNRLRNTENYQATISLSYETIEFTDWIATYRADMSAKGKKYWDNFNVYKQEPYELLNLSLALNNDNTQISLSIENALNQRYFSVLVPEFEFPFVTKPIAGVGDKRFISLDFTHEF
jgi:iron complex outermembrane receptor protein